MADKDSSSPNKLSSKEFVQIMGDKANRERSTLTKDNGVAGTDIGFGDLLSLKAPLEDFMEKCPAQLDAGNSCTGKFNMASGKTLQVKMDQDIGLDAKITSPDGLFERKVKFDPPKQQPGKIQLASNNPS